MRCTSPERLFGAVERRWSAFNRGCGITATLGNRGGTICVSYPDGLFDRVSCIAVAEAIRATLDMSRARRATVTASESGPLRTRTEFSVYW